MYSIVLVREIGSVKVGVSLQPKLGDVLKRKKGLEGISAETSGKKISYKVTIKTSAAFSCKEEKERA